MATSKFNFTNVSNVAFMCAGSKSAKSTVKLLVFLRFWDWALVSKKMLFDEKFNRNDEEFKRKYKK
jgi:hypothetical protein